MVSDSSLYRTGHGAVISRFTAMYFEIIGAVSEIEVIAEGRSVRGRRQLRRRYGGHRWRKLKGIGRGF